MVQEKSQWSAVTELMPDFKVQLGHRISIWLESEPEKILSYLSFYKFASKMIGRNKEVLDINCNEGLGTWIIAKESGCATGIESNSMSLNIARQNWNKYQIVDFFSFEEFNNKLVEYDGIVTFIEGDLLIDDGLLLNIIDSRLSENGIFIVAVGSSKININSRLMLDLLMRKFVHVFDVEKFIKFEGIINTFIACKKMDSL